MLEEVLWRDYLANIFYISRYIFMLNIVFLEPPKIFFEKENVGAGFGVFNLVRDTTTRYYYYRVLKHVIERGGSDGDYLDALNSMKTTFTPAGGA
ncbi:hypothetical protein ACJX0J_033372, partial [Zea mays]